jgi:hypothetical protein
VFDVERSPARRAIAKPQGGNGGSSGEREACSLRSQPSLRLSRLTKRWCQDRRLDLPNATAGWHTSASLRRARARLRPAGREPRSERSADSSNAGYRITRTPRTPRAEESAVRGSAELSCLGGEAARGEESDRALWRAASTDRARPRPGALPRAGRHATSSLPRAHESPRNQTTTPTTWCTSCRAVRPPAGDAARTKVDGPMSPAIPLTGGVDVGPCTYDDGRLTMPTPGAGSHERDDGLA